MNIEELYNFCLSISGAEASSPFGENTIVMKVCGKMFALIPLDGDEVSVSLKCDPLKAQELRQHDSSVTAAYHMNKKYWNTIQLNHTMEDEAVKFWIRHSVEEVLKKLPKRVQNDYYGAIQG